MKRNNWPPNWPYGACIRDTERNRAILKRRQEGSTLSQIGKEFGLSSERIRGICVLLGALIEARSKYEKDRAEIAPF